MLNVDACRYFTFSSKVELAEREQTELNRQLTKCIQVEFVDES